MQSANIPNTVFGEKSNGNTPATGAVQTLPNQLRPAETRTLWGRFWSTTGKYAMNFLIALDQLGNAIIFGDPDETISSRIGKIKRCHGGKIPVKNHPIAHTVDEGLDKIDPNHSIDAIEEDEGKNAIIRNES